MNERPIRPVSRRLKRIVIVPEILGHMFTPGNNPWVCVEGLPEGSQYRGVYLDDQRMTLSLGFEHESFPEVPENEAVPILRARCETRSYSEGETIQ